MVIWDSLTNVFPALKLIPFTVNWVCRSARKDKGYKAFANFETMMAFKKFYQEG